MSEGNNQFRGVAFGGFHRQDVLSYLKNTADEYEKTVASLREELDALKTEREEDQKRMEELESQLSESRERTDSLENALETARKDLESSQGVLEQEQKALGTLREQMAEAEPMAKAYARIKDRTAAIEINAHEQAQITIDRAKEEISELQDDCVRWVRELRDGYYRLRNDLNDTFAKSSSELDRICQTFNRVAQEFDEHEDTMQGMLQRAEDLQTDVVEV